MLVEAGEQESQTHEKQRRCREQREKEKGKRRDLTSRETKTERQQHRIGADLLESSAVVGSSSCGSFDTFRRSVLQSRRPVSLSFRAEAQACDVEDAAAFRHGLARNLRFVLVAINFTAW